MEQIISRELPQEQAGFRRGRGTRDHIANLRWIGEKAKEFQKKLYMCFIDYSKAFDCVNHDRLWLTLRGMGVPEHLTVLLHNLYDDQKAVVLTEWGETESFDIGKGVRQGCILSPMLFNLYTEAILRKVNLENFEGVKIAGRNITILRYTDDTTLMSETKEDLMSLITNIKKDSENAGLKLNIKKTKIMTNQDYTKFKLEDGEIIEVVDHYVFLRSQVDTKWNCQGEIKKRLTLGRKAVVSLQRLWKDSDLTVNTKVMLMKTLVFPIVMYACESWTPLKSDLKKIDSFELWCWRRMLRIPWTARRTNKSILEEVKPTTPLQVMILRQKLSYFGHIMRTNNDCMEKAIMLGMCEGRRKRGRTCRRWLDDIRKTTEKSLH